MAYEYRLRIADDPGASPLSSAEEEKKHERQTRQRHQLQQQLRLQLHKMDSLDNVPLAPDLKPLAAAPAPPRTSCRFTRLFATHRKRKLTMCGLVLAAILVVVVVVPIDVLKKKRPSKASAVSSQWGVTLLVDNDLEGPSSTKPAVFVLSDRSHADAAAGCSALGETLWDVNEAANATTASLQPLLNYLVYRQQATATTRFWIANASTSESTSSTSSTTGLRTIDINGTISLLEKSNSNNNSGNVSLPVLCTQRAPHSTATNMNTSTLYQVGVHAPIGAPDNGARGMVKVIGYRDHNSFRFLGMPYAAQPKRWTYSAPYWNRTLSAAVASGAADAAAAAAASDLPELNATFFRSACAQNIHATSENCLYVNVFTPYLPELGEVLTANSSASNSQLRPVMFFLHGGGLATGAGGLSTTDGGNLASRGDVVVVSINYRLGTLGYLALDAAHGGLPGNYGLGDQILALDWVRDNIAAFGGDPARITIFGQSAGAASVRAMMASPQAHGKFAAAAMMSGLGGVDNYGTPYSHYATVSEATTNVGGPLLEAAGCSSGDADTILACLRALPVKTILALSPVARFLVVDGTYLTAPELPLNRSSLAGSGNGGGGTVTPASYALLTGTMRDDGLSFISYPSDADAANVTAYLDAQGLNNPPRSASLFPLPTTDSAGRLPVGSADRASVFNMTVRLATDAMFRCNDQATVRAGLASGLFAAVYAYEFDRSYSYGGGGGLAEACRPPRTTDHPDGDPAQPYYRCHSGDLALVFGNVARLGLPWRDADGDRAFTGFALDSYAAFARAHDPTPDAAFLAARGFNATLAMLPKGASPLSAASTSDAWLPATNSSSRLPLHVLDWPATHQEAYREQPQCAGLGLGLDYYL